MEVIVSKLDRAENILENTIERFDVMRELIGPAGSIPMMLMNTDYNESVTDISVLFDDLNSEVLELQKEIKRENHG